MKKKASMKPIVKTYTEIFMGQRKEFPQGCAVTRVIPDKTKYNRKVKHKLKEW